MTPPALERLEEIAVPTLIPLGVHDLERPRTPPTASP